MHKILLTIIVILWANNARADDQVMAFCNGCKERLPECIQQVKLSEDAAPRWKIKNVCDFPIAILWCWQDVPKEWVHGENVCTKTGYISSGIVGASREFEFTGRPYLDNKFKPSAILKIKKVCKNEKVRECEH